MRNRVIFLTLLLLALSGCGTAIQIAGGVVPTTGDTAADASAAQRYLPNLSGYGYNATNAASITSAITSLGGSASLLTGDPVTAALITQIDSMIQCYQRTGSVAANIYTEANIANVLQGQIPKVGVLAVVNQNRVANNFLSCALGASGAMGAQAVTIEPCAGSGSFVRDNETLLYLYAATTPELCTLFVAAMPAA
jgi:hypothetical protein